MFHISSSSFEIIFDKLKAKIFNFPQEDISDLVALGKILVEIHGEINKSESIKELLEIKTKREFQRLVNFQNHMVLNKSDIKRLILDILKRPIDLEDSPMDLYLCIDLMQYLTASGIKPFSALTLEHLQSRVYKAWKLLESDYEGNLDSKELIRFISTYIVSENGNYKEFEEASYVFSAETSGELRDRMQKSKHLTIWTGALTTERSNLFECLKCSKIYNLKESLELLSLINQSFSLSLNKIEDLFKAQNFLQVLNTLFEEMYKAKDFKGPKMGLLLVIVQFLDGNFIEEPENSDIRYISLDFLKSIEAFCLKDLDIPLKKHNLKSPYLLFVYEMLCSDRKTVKSMLEKNLLTWKGNQDPIQNETLFYMFLYSLNQVKKEVDKCPIEMNSQEIEFKLKVICKGSSPYGMAILSEILSWQNAKISSVEALLKSSSKVDLVKAMCCLPNFESFTGYSKTFRLKWYLDVRQKGDFLNSEYAGNVLKFAKELFPSLSKCTSLDCLYNKDVFIPFLKEAYVFKSEDYGKVECFLKLCNFLRGMKGQISFSIENHISSYLLKEVNVFFEKEFESPYFSYLFGKKSFSECIKNAVGSELFFLVCDFHYFASTLSFYLARKDQMEKLKAEILIQVKKLEACGYDFEKIKAIEKVSKFFSKDSLIQEVRQICSSQNKEEFLMKLYGSKNFYELCPDVTPLARLKGVFESGAPIKMYLDALPLKEKALFKSFLNSLLNDLHLLAKVTLPTSKTTKIFHSINPDEEFLWIDENLKDVLSKVFLNSPSNFYRSTIFSPESPPLLKELSGDSWMHMKYLCHQVHINKEEFSEEELSLFASAADKSFWHEPMNETEKLFLKHLTKKYS